MLSPFIILIDPKYFSNVSLALFPYCWPDVILDDSTRVTEPVHHLNILINSILYNLDFFIFYERSKMVKQLFLCLYLDSIKCVCYKNKFFSKSKVHSLFFNFQIRSFWFIKHDFMCPIFTIKGRMISFTELIEFLSNYRYLSSHGSKYNFKPSFLFLKP